MISVSILLFGFAVQICYILQLIKKNTIKAVIAKTVSCSTFVIAGFLCGTNILIAVAMLTGYIGDVLLGVRRLVKCHKLLFAVGTLFFLAEHFILIITMLPLVKENILFCIIAEVFFFIVIYKVIKPCLKSGNGPINIIGVIYMFVLSTMVVSGINQYILNSSLNTILFMLGAISFVFSDTLLVHSVFGNDDPWMHPTSLVLYFLAQSLIGLSIVF